MSEGKSIIVTGASRGLGRAIVELILLNYPNVNVTAIARSSTALSELVSNLPEGSRSRILTIPGDVSDEITVNNAINKSLDKWGTIDGIVFNAGVLSAVGHLYDSKFDIEEVKRLFDVNFFSIVHFTNKLITKLNIKPGIADKPLLNILVVSSGASTRAIDGWLAYGASKASVNSLCTHLHQELYPVVRCSSVAPGVVATDMQKEVRDKWKDIMTPEAYERFTDLFKDGQLLDPYDVGAVYSKLVVEGIPSEIDGKYVRWNEINFSSLKEKNQ